MTTRARPFPAHRTALPTILLASAALLSGCTTSLSAALDTGTGAPPPGIPYRLPTKAIAVKASWVLESCKATTTNSTDKNGKISQKTNIDFVFAPTASFSEQLGEGERLVINYSNMVTAFKTGKVDVEYWKVGEGKDARQTSLLKSFNGEIKGEEAAAVKAGISVAGSLGRLALGLSKAPVQAGDDRQAKATRLDHIRLECDQALFGTEPPGLMERVKAAPDRQKAIAAEIEQRTIKLAAIKSRSLGKLSKADMAEFDKINAEEEALNLELKTIKDDVELRKTMFAANSELVFAPPAPPLPFDRPTKLGTVAANQTKLLELARKALVCVSALPFTAQDCSEAKMIAGPNATGAVTVPAALKVLAWIQPQAQPSEPVKQPKTDQERPSTLQTIATKGLAFREPLAVRVKLTLPEAAATADNDSGAGKTVAEGVVMMPQLGRLSYLPLSSGFAEKASLVASFDSDGMPTRIAFQKSEAGGTAALESIKLGVDQIAGIADAARAAEVAKAKEEAGSELATIKGRIEVLTAENNLDKLEAESGPEAAARAAELQQLRFEKERAELRAAIAKASP